MNFKYLQPAFATRCVGLLFACALPFASLPAHAQAASDPFGQLPPGHPGMQEPSPKMLAAEGVRTSANIARAAADICHIDTVKIARFKAKTKSSFPLAPDFDGEWNLGYKEAQSAVDRIVMLAKTDPKEHDAEIAEACPALSKGIDESTR